MEDLFALLNDHTGFQIRLGNGGGGISDLFVGNQNAALLNEAAGLTVGLCQAALHHQAQYADGILRHVLGGQLGISADAPPEMKMARAAICAFSASSSP